VDYGWVIGDVVCVRRVGRRSVDWFGSSLTERTRPPSHETHRAFQPCVCVYTQTVEYSAE
jgi:hypothetical protein